MKHKTHRENWKAKRMFFRGNTTGDYWESHMITPHGIVAVYTASGYSQIDFVYAGRWHRLCIHARLTEQQMSRAAWKFVNDVVLEANGQ